MHYIDMYGNIQGDREHLLCFLVPTRRVTSMILNIK